MRNWTINLNVTRSLESGTHCPPFFLTLLHVINRILKNVQRAGLIKKIGNFDTYGNVFNLHFGDDILLFLQNDS